MSSHPLVLQVSHPGCPIRILALRHQLVVLQRQTAGPNSRGPTGHSPRRCSTTQPAVRALSAVVGQQVPAGQGRHWLLVSRATCCTAPYKSSNPAEQRLLQRPPARAGKTSRDFLSRAAEPCGLITPAHWPEHGAAEAPRDDDGFAITAWPTFPRG
ncbi:hypothetical protein SCOCK_700005 [Actinacidiphila cocklensis]|uniref:Uncharacterized protein n=1 Tax=Actinacidiphila cocklensis TaxID=887465 RepID=A0A9W4GVH0_9ACTN|nr:hypothetical protein SCOCK_700005 [Actinacidiphila cocklensis]